MLVMEKHLQIPKLDFEATVMQLGHNLVFQKDNHALQLDLEYTR